MDSLTPFVRHELELPDASFQPPDFSLRVEPDPDEPIPMTDGTPVACRQKNAEEFLDGTVSGVMAQYGEQLFGTEQNTDSAHPAPEEPDPAKSGVLELVNWREDAPYG